MRNYSLPLSIVALAGAIALHAMLPAFAAPPAAPPPAPAAPVEPPPPPPPPPTPNCEKFQGKVTTGVPLSEIQSWMTQQRNAGRASFVAVAADPAYSVLCAY
jgi:hypothetical protein